MFVQGNRKVALHFLWYFYLLGPNEPLIKNVISCYIKDHGKAYVSKNTCLVAYKFNLGFYYAFCDIFRQKYWITLLTDLYINSTHKVS